MKQTIFKKKIQEVRDNLNTNKDTVAALIVLGIYFWSLDFEKGFKETLDQLLPGFY